MKTEKKPLPTTPPVKTPSPEELAEREKNQIKEKCLKFEGSVWAFIYRPHMGFADYSIVKMRLESGKVVEIEEVSDPYGAFEARARMETKQSYDLEKMRTSYPAGFQHV